MVEFNEIIYAYLLVYKYKCIYLIGVFYPKLSIYDLQKGQQDHKKMPINATCL